MHASSYSPVLTSLPSEGASFESPRDGSLREVLAFGEDYGDFLRWVVPLSTYYQVTCILTIVLCAARRRSEPPSLPDLAGGPAEELLPASPSLLLRRAERELVLGLQVRPLAQGFSAAGDEGDRGEGIRGAGGPRE